MSKSAHNYIGVSEEPNEMFGKLMSVSDELMDRYYLLLLGTKRDESLRCGKLAFHPDRLESADDHELSGC